MPKVKGRKVQGRADAGGRDVGPWWERATGGNFLKLEAGKRYALRLTNVPRERSMRYKGGTPRPVLDIPTDKGTLTVGLQSSLAAFLGAQIPAGKGPEVLRGHTVRFAIKGSKTEREYLSLSYK